MIALNPLDFEHDVAVVMDRSGFVRFVSQPEISYQEDTRKPSEVIGHHFREFMHPDDAPNFATWLKQNSVAANAGAGPSHLLFRVRRPSGSWRWLEATRPHLEGHHVRDYIILFLRDIAAHRDIEHQYRLAESIAGYGIWSIRRNSPYATLSAGMVRLFGYEPGDPETQRKFWPIKQVEREDVQRVLKTLRRAFETPQEFSFICSVRTREGSKRVLKTRGHVRCDVSGMDSLFGISQDITMIHMAKVRLRASEEQYRLLTQRASDIICQLDSNGRIEFISPSVRRLTGRRPSRLTGLNFAVLLPKSEHEAFWRFLACLKEGDERALCTVRFNGLDNAEAWLEISGQALKDEKGSVYGMVCAARDISERKEFERALQKSRQEAEEANASKSAFLASVSHELRTPLNAIMGYSELVRDMSKGSEHEARFAEYASLIHESGAMLNSLVNDLLDLSKIEAGKYELKLQSVPLKEIVPLCVQQIRPQAMKKHIAVTDAVSGTRLNVHADIRALKQIFINLLANAVNFTPEGGEIELSAYADHGRITLNVRDTGIGIEKGNLERITAPFEQVKGTGMARKGSGLGLALVKSLVELHGGELAIASEPGRGTTVSVVLPAAEADRKVVA